MIFHLTIISVICYYYQVFAVGENNSFLINLKLLGDTILKNIFYYKEFL